MGKTIAKAMTYFFFSIEVITTIWIKKKTIKKYETLKTKSLGISIKKKSFKYKFECLLKLKT